MARLSCRVMVTGHLLVRADEVVLRDAWPALASGLRRAELLGGAAGTVHCGLGMAELAGDGRIDVHVHSHEEAFYVLEGAPVLVIGGRGVRLEPGACGVVPVGVEHAWRGGGRWIDMRSPRPREDGSDTFAVGVLGDVAVEALDLRDPRNRHLFALRESDMDIDALARGAAAGAPTVSASMSTAALLYSGITVKMLVDARLDAQLLTMFMVDYRPGAVAHPHDHPFEESYVMLDGEVDVVADGRRYTLGPGDVFWTGVGCVHAFYEMRGGTARWLETSAPAPPPRHAYRFERDWDRLRG